MPISRPDLDSLAADHGCTTTHLRNGAAHVKGTGPRLKCVWDAIWSRYRVSPLLVLSSTVDGVPEAGFPRIEVHPQVLVTE